MSALLALPLAIVSLVALAGGCFLYVSQAWSGPQASLRIRLIGVGCAVVGVAGLAAAVGWGLKPIWSSVP